MPLKFLIRTSDMSYPILQGQYHLDGTTSAPASLLEHRYFSIQVHNDNNSASSTSEFYGCCGNEHSRIILVREMNFVHYCSDWDLYVAALPTHDRSFQLLQLILVPYTLHTNECREFKDWTYIGTCRANIMRLDVEAFVLQYLKGWSHNQQLDPQRYTYPCEHTTFQITDSYNVETTTTSSTYHWHIEVYMDSMVDESYATVSMSTYLTPSSVQSSDCPDAPPIDTTKDLYSACNKENNISKISSFAKIEEDNTCDSTSVLQGPIIQKRKKSRRPTKPYRR